MSRVRGVHVSEFSAAPTGSLESVHYYEISEDLGYYGDFSPAGHPVDIGVELRFAGGGIMSLTWVKWNIGLPIGYVGHLVVVEHMMDELLLCERAHYEVSNWPAWAEFIGQPVSAIEHVRDVDSPSSRVAVTLSFERGSVTFALGDTESSGEIEYSIDNILVMHNRDVAALYLDALGRTGPVTVAGDRVCKAAGLG